MATNPDVQRVLGALKGGRLIITLVLGAALLIAIGRTASEAYVEILWQVQAGYADVFWSRVVWEWGVRILAGLAVGAVVFLNLKIVSRTLSGLQIKRRFGNLEISEQLPKSYVLWGMLGISGLLALWFGAAVPANLGLQILILKSAAVWGLADPVLGHDVSFYVFWVPVLASLITLALIVVFMVFTLATAGYAATGSLRWGRGRVDAQDITRIHLGALLALFFVMLGARLWLSRYLLLLDGSSAVRGIFGFTDAQARMPALQTLTIICVMGGAGVFWGAWKNRVTPILTSSIAVVLGMLVIGEFYPAMIQSFRVEPNELVRETPFIEHNLEFTRRGFALDNMERRSFSFESEQAIDWPTVARQFSGLPVWTRGALLATYREIEARYPYYDFPDVTIDRYPGPDGPVAVAVSVREVDPGGIQDPNWQNLHLRERYIEGMGAVASLASERTPQGRPPMLISGIPPEASPIAESVPSLALGRSEVYFGRGQQRYAVINAGAGEFNAPDGAVGSPGVDFPAGIELAGAIRTAVLAWRFRDSNLLFASDLTDDSRLIYRRRVQERVRAIAPFIRVPEPEYPVVADGRIVWILEGFTGTRAFPLSTVHELGTFRSQVTYARNSVKIVVDAVTGDVDFYRVPIEDPLLDAYDAAFPGLFKPLSEMPESVRSHVRYSTALLNLQSRVLLQYHQETAPAFHGQQDVWDLSQELAQGTSPVPYRPEYGIYALPGEDEERFNLTTVFVPAGRQNLTGILAGRTDEAGVPELILYDVPIADQVPGPRQIEALVEQDPDISQEFSLWRTGGSQVWTGHLHLVPAGDRILYMEPVFLAAEADAIPELRRFVVSDGVRVVMTEDLASAMTQLAGLEIAIPGTVLSGEDLAPTSDLPEGSTAAWAASALDLLEAAEASAREGDWQGFGDALEELRMLLQRLEGGGG
jgi:uncharacterized protein